MKSKRKRTKILPSVEYLRACFECDPATDILRWKPRPQKHFPDAGTWASWNSRYAGKIAGTIQQNGRRSILINRRPYLAHRIGWKLRTGREPPASIDHKDRDYTNDVQRNLRAATRQQQRWNSRPQKSISGYRCVYRNKKKWQALIHMNGHNRSLGYYATPKEASAIVEPFLRKLHGAFYRSPGFRT
jgi:hypothetical protein